MAIWCRQPPYQLGNWPAIRNEQAAHNTALGWLLVGFKAQSQRSALTYQRGKTMSKVCQVTGKRPITGNNVSHAKNHTKRRFLPNLHSHRFWVEAEKRFVRLRVSAKGMRVIDKRGIETVLAELRARGEKV